MNPLINYIFSKHLVYTRLGASVCVSDVSNVGTRDGAAVASGTLSGAIVSAPVGTRDDDSVGGTIIGAFVRGCDGDCAGTFVGESDDGLVGTKLNTSVDTLVANYDGEPVGTLVGGCDGDALKL